MVESGNIDDHRNVLGNCLEGSRSDVIGQDKGNRAGRETLGDEDSNW